MISPAFKLEAPELIEALDRFTQAILSLNNLTQPAEPATESAANQTPPKEAATEPQYKIEDVRKVLSQLTKPEAKAILEAAGCNKLSDAAPEQYGEMIAAAKEKM